MKSKKHILLLIVFGIITLFANAINNEAWMDSVINDGVRQIKTADKAGKYLIIVDAAKYLTVPDGEGVTLQNNKWHYESGDNTTPFDFSGDITQSSEIETILSNFNTPRKDNIRLYTILIKNIPFLVKNQLATIEEGESLNLLAQINNLKKKNPKDYSNMQQRFGTIIKSIREQSQYQSIICGVGHFYCKYDKSENIANFYSESLDVTQVISKSNKKIPSDQQVKDIRVIFNGQKKEISSASPKNRFQTTLPLLIDNIHCSIDNQCKEVTLPIDLANHTFFDHDKLIKTPRADNSISIGKNDVELYDMSDVLENQKELGIVNSWAQTCTSLGYKLKVFLTDAGTNPNVLIQIQAYKYSLPDKTVMLWIHARATGYVTADFALSGKLTGDLKQQVYRDAVGRFLNRIITAKDQVMELPFKICEGLGNWLDKNVKIPEKYYNPEAVDYNEFVFDIYASLCLITPCDGPLSTILPLIDVSIGTNIEQHNFAFYCGVWNGIVGQVSGLGQLVGILGIETKRVAFFKSIKSMFTSDVSIWSTIKQQLTTTYGNTSNTYILLHNYGELALNVAACFIGIGELKALATGGTIAIDFAKFANLTKALAKTMVAGAKNLYKLGKYVVELVVENGKLIFKIIKDEGNNIVADVEKFSSALIKGVGNDYKLGLADGSESPLSFVEKIYNETGKEVGKLYKTVESEPVIIGNYPSLIRQLFSKPAYLSYRVILSNPNKTTTMIGKWFGELENVYKELATQDLNIYMISGKFEHKGGFNMLSIDDWSIIVADLEAKGIYKGTKAFDDYIWDNFNKPWIESAMQRGDDIVLWSDPSLSKNLIKDFDDIGPGETFFSREISFIKNNAPK